MSQNLTLRFTTLIELFNPHIIEIKGNKGCVSTHRPTSCQPKDGHF